MQPGLGSSETYHKNQVVIALPREIGRDLWLEAPLGLGVPPPDVDFGLGHLSRAHSCYWRLALPDRNVFRTSVDIFGVK